MKFTTSVSFPLGAGGEAGAFAGDAETIQPAICFRPRHRNAHVYQTLPGLFSPGCGECVTQEGPCCPDEPGWAGLCVLTVQGVFPVSWCDVMVSLQCGNTPFPDFQGNCKWVVGRRSRSEVGQASK